MRLRTAAAIGRLAARSVATFAVPFALALLAAGYLFVGATGDDRALTAAPVSGDDDLLRFS